MNRRDQGERGFAGPAYYPNYIPMNWRNQGRGLGDPALNPGYAWMNGRNHGGRGFGGPALPGPFVNNFQRRHRR